MPKNYENKSKFVKFMCKNYRALLSAHRVYSRDSR